ncbi:MAG: HEPN domain-containing protein [Deltaproteobacteria bacterium]|nr:HEPN domain-containing protein [Deltaproteobacteria bacterium]
MAGKRRTEARRWFQQGLFDLKAAEWNMKGGFYNTACFLCQQSAEKALKSVLYYCPSRGMGEKPSPLGEDFSSILATERKAQRCRGT